MLYEDGGACDVSSACAACGYVDSVDSVEGRTLEIRNVLGRRVANAFGGFAIDTKYRYIGTTPEYIYLSYPRHCQRTVKRNPIKIRTVLVTFNIH